MQGQGEGWMDKYWDCRVELKRISCFENNNLDLRYEQNSNELVYTENRSSGGK